MYIKIISLKCASDFISAYVFKLCASLLPDYLSLESLLQFKYNLFPCLFLLKLSWVFSLPSDDLVLKTKQNKVLNGIVSKLPRDFKICMKSKYLIASISIVSWIFHFLSLVHNQGHIFIYISLSFHVCNLLHDIIAYSKNVKISAEKMLENFISKMKYCKL